jgi:hypothetical protein
VAPEPEGSSPYSQEPATGPYPEPTESTVHSPNQCLQDPFWIPSSRLRLGLPSGLFPSGFPTKSLYTFPFQRNNYNAQSFCCSGCHVVGRKFGQHLTLELIKKGSDTTRGELLTFSQPARVSVAREMVSPGHQGPQKQPQTQNCARDSSGVLAYFCVRLSCIWQLARLVSGAVPTTWFPSV